MENRLFYVARLVLLAVLPTTLMLAVACSPKSENAYTITGTAEGTTDGDTVYICEMQGFFSMMPTDTAIVKGGKFEFSGECEGASLRFLVPIHNGEPTTTALFILEKGDIKATLSRGEETEAKIEGGPNGELFEEYNKGLAKIHEHSDTYWEIAGDQSKSEEERQAANEALDSLHGVTVNYQKQFIIDHVPSAISDMLYGFCQADFTESDREEILKLFGEKQPEFPVYKAVMERRQAEAATNTGQKYRDLAMDAPDGKTIKISDYVGKSRYVLVDFWASWCGPCRAEMPTVVEAYTAYHGKGLEVLGVSLDENKSDWTAAIKELNMPWPQMSDLKGWESQACATYQVQSIPSNVLIDEQGIIVAKNLRGQDLLDKMAELMP